MISPQGQQGGAFFDNGFGVLVDFFGDLVRAARVKTAIAVVDHCQAIERVGSDGILVDPQGAVGLARPGMSVELGGLAKGWALDRAREALRAHAVRAAFAKCKMRSSSTFPIMCRILIAFFRSSSFALAKSFARFTVSTNSSIFFTELTNPTSI